MDDLDLGSTIKGFTPGQKVFARYTLKKILGRGGMGVVWLARDEELERAVALKFLPEAVAMDGEAVTDLKRETRRNLQLTHANIVRVHDFLQDARSAAISMEHVDGASLSALKTGEGNGVFPVDRLDPLVAQLCAALEYAHGTARIVHRDLKPANLLLATTGILKVTDFGIARSVADSIDRISAQAGGSSGTPAYMSPQQMLGGEPAVTDDIYAVGATLYDLLTGKPPFHSGNIGQQVQSRIAPRLNERRRELGLAPVPTAWEETIAACLAKLPASRPQSAAELLHRLRGSPSASVAASGPSAASPHRPSGRASRGPALGLAAVVLFGGLIAGGWFFGFGGSSGPVDAPERPAAKTPGRLAGPLRA
ncbi:MAG TPA: serine/threonine-protein kinase, partial [Opitutaceae bacterium]|nr:serine/threonine-protein kinase [Opitutaceae bacterium]